MIPCGLEGFSYVESDVAANGVGDITSTGCWETTPTGKEDS